MRFDARFYAVAALLVLAVVAVAAAPAMAKKPRKPRGVDCTQPSATIKDDGTPLDGICDYLATREGVMQVALFDNKTGRTFVLSNGDATQYTASIVKVDILARWLRRYQQDDVKIPADIPYSVKYLMGRMIQNSDNAAATSLFYFGGGCDALTKFNRLIPMNDTKVGCESQNYYGWGNTQTTAADQVALMRKFAYADGNGVLGGDARDYGNKLMQGVQPDQRFGITCGPWGNTCDPPNWANPVDGVTVSLKNGWKTLPTCTDPIPQCPWQVNSTGSVNGQGRDYVLSVLTTKDPVGTGDIYGFNYGIETIQGASRLVWSNLG
jgi:hypothetical protein